MTILYTLPMTAFVLQWQSTCSRYHMAQEPKIFIIQFFMEKNTNLAEDKCKHVNDILLVIYMEGYLAKTFL